MGVELSLDGQIAILTGAGRRDGMGWSAALRLAEAGAIVIATGYGRKPLSASLNLGDISRYYDEARTDNDAKGDLAELEKLLRERSPQSATLPLDVTAEAEVSELAEIVSRQFGGVDILFNNAGVAFGAGAFEALTTDQWQHSINVNLLGVVNMCRAFLPLMEARGGGSVINNASIAGLRGSAYLSAYSASKFAVVGLTQALAAEWGSRKIRVNAVCPGAIHTRMGDLEYAFSADLMETTIEEAIAAITSTIPLGRLGQASDVSDAVLFLASPLSTFVTGMTLPVTGGQP